MAVNSQDHDGGAHRQAPRVPWHNRTSTVLGASVAGLAAIVIVFTSATYLVRQFDEPERAPINYVGPSAPTGTSSKPAAPSTITSTRPPITSDINPDPTPPGTGSAEVSSRNPNYRAPRTREDDSSEAQTTRSRPRTSVPRTLNPAR